MIHARIDDDELNANARFACGLSGKLPDGDVYYRQGEAGKAGFRGGDVCPGCYPGGKPKIGTPLSELSGRPGHAGYGEFKRISDSWGYP